MKSFVRKYRTLLIIIVLVGVGYMVFGRSKTTTVVPTLADTIEVSKGNISSTLQVLGTTNLTTSQLLTFGQPGKVTKVYVKQGDTVRKGQVLAEIDKRDAENSIKQQQLSIQSAQISYDKLFTTTKPYQITQVEQNAEQATLQAATAQLEIKNLQLEKANKLQDQKEILAEKNRNLALLQALGTGDSLDEYNTSAAAAANDALDTIQQVRDAIRTLKDILHTDTPLDKELLYIGANIQGSVDTANQQIKTLENELPQFESTYANFLATNPKTTNTILDLQSKNKDIILTFSNTAQAVSKAINASITDTRYYTEATLSSNKNTTSSMNSKAISLLNSINNSIKTAQTNGSTIATLQNDIANAQRTIESINASYDLQIKQKQDSIINNKADALISEQNAQSLKDGPTYAERAASQNQIAQAQLSLDKAQKTIENYQIIAQFDGTVTAAEIKVGDQVGAMSEGITVEVPGIYEVKVLFDQLDIVKIGLGQHVTLSFDAYPDQMFTGVIDKIDPTPQTTQGVVSYTAVITLKKDGKVIYNSMSATVNVILEEKNDVIVVPSLAIISSTGGQKFVQVWDNGSIKRTPVVTGITDGQKTEIVSGISVGQRITTKQFNITSKAKGFSIIPPRGSGSNAGGGQRGPGGGSAPAGPAGG